jgi:hypothetical protein
MLAVRVHAAGVLVSVLCGVSVSRRDCGPQPPVLVEREHVGAMLARDLGGPVERPVVHDEHVGVRKLAAELREDAGEVVLLVPGRDENERVPLLGHSNQRTSRRIGISRRLRPTAA